MRARRRLGGWVLAAGALATAVTACGDDDGDDGDAGRVDQAFSVTASLEQIPASAVIDRDDTPIRVVAGDLDRAAEVAGVQRPAEVDVDSVVDWVGPMTGRRVDGSEAAALLLPEVVNVNFLAGIEEFDDEVGWSLLEVHHHVELQQPPQFLSVLTGDFDEAAIDAAQGAPTDDIWSLGGEDFAVDVEEVSAARPLGGAMRTALVDGHLAVARSTAPVRAWLDSGDDTLADDASMAAVAGALDDADVYSAMLLSADPPEDRGGPADEGLAPFDALGVGSAADDDGALVVLAYAHRQEADAEANVERLRTELEEGSSMVTDRPWTDLLTLADITRDGTTVTVTLRLAADDTNPMIGYQAVLQRDTFSYPG